jgi:hypothetical protein
MPRLSTGKASGKKGKFAERRVSTAEDLVNTPPPIPHNLAIDVSYVEYSMLRDKFLMGGFLLPTIHADLQLTFKPIHEPYDVVIALKFRVPGYAIDDI